MVLTVIVMNLRLVVENARKYGLLISLKSNLQSTDIKITMGLYALTPCHLFAAYLIERVAMENAKGVIGRRKKNDNESNTSEVEQEHKDFYYTWWWIAVAHAVNATLALLITSCVVYYWIDNPGLGFISEDLFICLHQSRSQARHAASWWTGISTARHILPMSISKQHHIRKSVLFLVGTYSGLSTLLSPQRAHSLELRG
jgi:hypothetical protein